jgi:hypothetical protein
MLDVELVKFMLSRRDALMEAEEAIGELFPLSVKVVRMRFGLERSWSRRKRMAFAEFLAPRMLMKPLRVARSMATKR